MDTVRKTRNVAIVVYDQVEVLDFAGPFEVFSVGSDRGKDFRVFTVAEKEGPVTALGNLSLNPSYTFDTCPPPDVLVLPGGWGSRIEMHNERMAEWIRETAEQAELVLTVCTGALLLARAISLEGMTLTTNRRAIDELRAVAPKSSVIKDDVRYTDNGKIIMSAGVSAGIDASLYVVGKLLGEERADDAAGIMEYEWTENEQYAIGD